MRSMVEGAWHSTFRLRCRTLFQYDAPSTALRAVPLPHCRGGGEKRAHLRLTNVLRVDAALGERERLELTALAADHQLIERGEIGLGRCDERIGIGAFGRH
jgi:hypothetical protein